MERLTDWQTDQWIDGWTDGRTDCLTNGQMDGRFLFQKCMSAMKKMEDSCHSGVANVKGEIYLRCLSLSQKVYLFCLKSSQIVSNRLTLSQIVSKDISVSTHFIGKRRKRIIQTIFLDAFSFVPEWSRNVHILKLENVVKNNFFLIFGTYLSPLKYYEGFKRHMKQYGYLRRFWH